jgi:CBS domain-containing protein
MSPRAALRLERLGFDPVYDYAAGKVDWMAAGLPTVRADTTERRALDVADRSPPTCPPELPVATAARLAADAGWPSVVVIDGDRVVLGRLGPAALAGPGDVAAEEAMEPGPSTVRAHEPLEALLERMRTRRVTEMLVTTPEGRLLGVVREDVG